MCELKASIFKRGKTCLIYIVCMTIFLKRIYVTGSNMSMGKNIWLQIGFILYQNVILKNTKYTLSASDCSQHIFFRWKFCAFWHIINLQYISIILQQILLKTSRKTKNRELLSLNVNLNKIWRLDSVFFIPLFYFQASLIIKLVIGGFL